MCESHEVRTGADAVGSGVDQTQVGTVPVVRARVVITAGLTTRVDHLTVVNIHTISTSTDATAIRI